VSSAFAASGVGLFWFHYVKFKPLVPFIMANCSFCGCAFVFKGKSYNCLSFFSSKRDGVAPCDLFFSLFGNSFIDNASDIYICCECFGLLRKSYHLQLKINSTKNDFIERCPDLKRKLEAQNVEPNAKKQKCENQAMNGKNFKTNATVALQNSKYTRLFEILISNSQTAKKALAKIFSKTIKKEVFNFDTKSLEDVSIKTIQDFSWTKFLELCSQQMPVLYKTITASMGK
jgi:hypothetical protein